MRMSTRLAWLGTLWTGAAWAQVDPCAQGQNNVCVSFSTAQGVPLSPQAMVLLAAILGVLAYVKLRKNASGLWGLGLSLAFGAWLTLQPGGAGWANGFHRENFSTGNPVVSSANISPLVVVNNLARNATITAITIDGYPFNPAPGTYGGYERCHVGKVLVPWVVGSDPIGTCVIQFV